MKLTGFKFKNSRSIGPAEVSIDPFSKCNVLIGRNNSGKSNVIRALQRAFLALRGEGVSLDELDQHRISAEHKFEFQTSFVGTGADPLTGDGAAGTNSFWFRFRWTRGSKPKISDYSLAHLGLPEANKTLHVAAGRTFRRRLSATEIHAEMMKHADRAFERYFLGVIPEVHMIPEFRKISSEGGDPFGGAALVERLSRWQHPPPGDDSKRRKFEKLEDFLQRLLHFPHAKLEVTHDKQVVLDNAGLRLPNR